MPSAPRHSALRSSRSWPQRLAIGAGCALTIVCVGFASALGYLLWKTGNFQRVDVPLDAAAANEPRNYLIIGSDSRDNVDPQDPDAGAFLGPGEPGGKRSDTILVLRVDPVASTVKMLSFPRDLWVPMADSGQNDRINSAYGRGRAVLVDTIRKDFGIEINNYIEVDFHGFKSLVSAIGGVNMYFDTPMRDDNTGLDIENAGCVTLDGDQALAFARARHVEFKDARGHWQEDPTADLGRITRQQIFVRKAMNKVMSLGITDLPTFSKLLDVAVDSVTIDQTLNRSNLYSLVKKFKGLNPEEIETYSLPVANHMTNGGAAVVLLQPKQAQPILDVFRGKDPTEPTVQEGDYRVEVMNGSGAAGQARDVRTALDAVGFRVGTAGNAALTSHTVIRYAPGSEAGADLLSRHLTTPAALQSDSSLAAGDFTLITGTDFTTVMENARPPDPTTLTAAVPPATGGTDAGTDGGTPTTAPTTTSTTVVGVTPGEAPPGVDC